MLNKDVIEDLGPRVPAVCEHPECTVEITRGRVNTCGADPAGTGGCGLNFCGTHLQGPGQTCERCAAGAECFTRKPEHPDWTDFKLTGDAWAQWRADHPEEVMALAVKKGQQMREQHAKHATGKPDKEEE